MSQNIDLSTVNNKLSSADDEFDNSNHHWKSTSDITVVNQSNHNDWANFDAFENNHNSECLLKTTTNSNDADDDWADFQSNTEHSVELTNVKDDEVSISSTSVNSLNVEQIDNLISTCFPLESPILSTDTDLSFSLELPTFTTFKDPAKQLPSLQPSLRLWNVLSSIPTDPIGVRYQWRKSNVEHLFHTALGFQNKTISTTTTVNSSVDELQRNGMGNPLTDVINSSEIDDNLFDVSTTPDVDYYIPSKLTSSSNTEPIRRTNSPIPPIKTTDLFPGSTTVLNDESKFVVNSPSNLTFINPKALMSSVQLTPESTI